MTAVAYATSRWAGDLHYTTRVLLYDVRERPFCELQLPYRAGRGEQAVWRVEMQIDKFHGLPCPERNGELTLIDIGPYRVSSDTQLHVKASCSCGAVLFVRRGEWFNRTKKCKQRCTVCSHRMQRGGR